MIALAITLCSCASATPPNVGERSPKEAQASSAALVDESRTSATPEGSAKPAPLAMPADPPPRAPTCDKLWLADACISRQVLDTVDLDAFFKREGIRLTKPASDSSCREIAIGTQNVRGLHCKRGHDETSGALGSNTYTYRLAESDAVYVIRSRTLSNVFDQLSRFDVLDKDDPSEGPLFALKVSVSDDGQFIDVEEPATGACATALARLSEAVAMKPSIELASSLAWSRADLRLLKRMCDRLGRYRWNGSQYRPETARPTSFGSG